MINLIIWFLWVFCLRACLCTTCLLDDSETRKGCWISWVWSYGLLWDPMWMLRIRLWSSALNCWVLSSGPVRKFWRDNKAVENIKADIMEIQWNLYVCPTSHNLGRRNRKWHGWYWGENSKCYFLGLTDENIQRIQRSINHTKQNT